MASYKWHLIEKQKNSKSLPEYITLDGETITKHKEI